MAWLGSHYCKRFRYRKMLPTSSTDQLCRYFTSVFVSLGVFLFGYDQGVMSGIITSVFPFFFTERRALLTHDQRLVFQGLLQSTLASCNRYGGCNPWSRGFHILSTCRSNRRLDRTSQNDPVWLYSIFHRRCITGLCYRFAYDDGRSYRCRFGRWGLIDDCTSLPVWNIGICNHPRCILLRMFCWFTSSLPTTEGNWHVSSLQGTSPDMQPASGWIISVAL